MASTPKNSTESSEVNSEGQTALHVAVMDCNCSEIKRLLSLAETDINAKDNGGHTPLHTASLCNKIDTHHRAIEIIW